MKGQTIESILNMYIDTRIREQLTKYRNVNKRNIIENMLKILEDSLMREEVHESMHMEEQDIRIEEGNTVYIGDIHGNFNGLLKMLKVSKLVDHEGNWIGKNRTLVQVGDVIDRGENSWESLLYLRCLQYQAREAGGDVVCLMGNHEQAVIFEIPISPQDFYFNAFDMEENESGFLTAKPKPGLSTEKDLARERAVLRELLKEDIKAKRMCLAYSDKEHNLLTVHASMEKNVLKEFVIEKLYDLSERRVALALKENQKVSTEALYRIMSDRGWSIDDVSNWLNFRLEKSLAAGMPFNPWDVVLGANGVVWSRSKYKKMKTRSPEDSLKEIKKQKFLQIVGHTPIDELYHGLREVQGEGVKRIHNNVFIDTAIEEGNLSISTVIRKKLIALMFKGRYWKGKILAELAHCRDVLADKCINIKTREMDTEVEEKEEVKLNAQVEEREEIRLDDEVIESTEVIEEEKERQSAFSGGYSRENSMFTKLNNPGPTIFNNKCLFYCTGNGSMTYEE